MLDLDLTSEARALYCYAEEQGQDPEPTAEMWADATVKEAAAVVREVYRLYPKVKGAEWYEDFLYAHSWNKRQKARLT